MSLSHGQSRDHLGRHRRLNRGRRARRHRLLEVERGEAAAGRGAPPGARGAPATFTAMIRGVARRPSGTNGRRRWPSLRVPAHKAGPRRAGQRAAHDRSRRPAVPAPGAPPRARARVDADAVPEREAARASNRPASPTAPGGLRLRVARFPALESGEASSLVAARAISISGLVDARRLAERAGGSPRIWRRPKDRRVCALVTARRAAAHPGPWRSWAARARRRAPPSPAGSTAPAALPANPPLRRSPKPDRQSLRTARYRRDREIAQFALGQLVPGHRRRDASVGHRPHRVRRCDRSILGVLVVVDEDAVALFLPPLARAICGARRSTSRARARAERRTSSKDQRRSDPNVDMDSARA